MRPLAHKKRCRDTALNPWRAPIADASSMQRYYYCGCAASCLVENAPTCAFDGCDAIPIPMKPPFRSNQGAQIPGTPSTAIFCFRGCCRLSLLLLLLLISLLLLLPVANPTSSDDEIFVLEESQKVRAETSPPEKFWFLLMLLLSLTAPPFTYSGSLKAAAWFASWRFGACRFSSWSLYSSPSVESMSFRTLVWTFSSKWVCMTQMHHQRVRIRAKKPNIFRVTSSSLVFSSSLPPPSSSLRPSATTMNNQTPISNTHANALRNARRW
mmetsp:Transcript_9733/g.22939  ORF Transcript_9733/g.22939 Transcript_9733/m.22939 type:complete len:268 (-) Transcript_9733:8-811(-)